MTQAITIKSKKRYPEKTDLIKTSIYFDELYDFKLYKSFKIPFAEINQKPFNSSASLGKPPMGNLEDVKTTQEIINDINSFQDTSNDIYFGFNNNIKDNSNNTFYNKNIINSEILPDNAEKFTSYFDFIDKRQIFGNLFSYNSEILYSTQSHSNTNKDSKLMKEFMRSKKKQKIKKPEDDAPITISSKHQMTRFNKPEEILRRYTNCELQFNIPMNVNLSHIAQFETNNMNMENYFNEEHEVILPPQSQIYSDDTVSYQTPVDMLKNQNITNKQNNISMNNNQAINNNNSNSSNQVNKNINFNNKQNSDLKQNNSKGNQFNNTNFSNNNNLSSENKSTQQTIPNPMLNLVNPSNSVKIPDPPKIPQPPSTSATIPNPPKILNPPSVLQAPTGPKKELPKEAGDLREKLPVSSRVNMAEEIFLEAEKRRQMAKTVKINPNPEIKKEPVKNTGGKMSLMDALKSDNPMGRLKKAGTIVVSNNDPAKDGEKKNVNSI